MNKLSMMSAQAAACFTVDEYLKLERAAEFRSEYIQGQIIAMSGASRNHVRIAAASLSLLHGQFRGRPCEAFGSDLRLHISAHNAFTYPHVVVTCGGAGVRDREEDSIEDATLIIEVLSPSTANYDHAVIDLASIGCRRCVSPTCTSESCSKHPRLPLPESPRFDLRLVLLLCSDRRSSGTNLLSSVAHGPAMFEQFPITCAA